MITLYVLVGFLAFFALSMQLTSLQKELRGRLERIETQVAQISRELGVAPDDTHLEAVRDELARGRTLAAIKAYRAATGADLRQAKAAVDRIAREEAAGPPHGDTAQDDRGH